MKKTIFSILLVFLWSSSAAPMGGTVGMNGINSGKQWRIAIISDLHHNASDYWNNSQMISDGITSILNDKVDVVLVCGDIIPGNGETGSACNDACGAADLDAVKSLLQPLYDAGISVYVVRGNHDAQISKSTWDAAFSGAYAMPQNGPTGEVNVTFSATHKNATFIGMDALVNIYRINQTWLNTQLSSKSTAHIFPMSHYMAFQIDMGSYLSEDMVQYTTERNTFWQSLVGAGVETYLSGHHHVFALSYSYYASNSHQAYECNNSSLGGHYTNGSAGYSGSVNSPYTVSLLYTNYNNNGTYWSNGYTLIELNGSSNTDLDETIIWKRGVLSNGTYTYVPTYQKTVQAPSM